MKEDGKTMNLAATEKGDGGTKGTSTLQGFKKRIMKSKADPAYLAGKKTTISCSSMISRNKHSNIL